MSKPKKKRTPHEIEMSRLMREARASVELDGCTQSCEACGVEAWLLGDWNEYARRKSVEGAERVFDSIKVWAARPAHRCEKRPMTPAERAVVEAAEKLREWRMSPKGDPFPLSRPELNVIHAVAALRAERKES